MRIALGVEYNGHPYMGWQIQSHVDSIQGQIEKALSLIADEPISQSQVAGRTDKGVHATGQVMHFDTDIIRSESAWVNGTNRHLVDQHISIIWAKQVSDKFHARFSTLRRRYRYILLNRPVRPSFLSRLVSWDNRPLSLKPMQTAAKHLLGEHNFNAYRTVHCQSKIPVKTIYELSVKQQGDLFFFDVEANSFLHHMVRNIVGVLMAIGRHEYETDWSKSVLKSQDRTKGGVTAPANGLYLTKVVYDNKFELPEFNQSLLFFN